MPSKDESRHYWSGKKSWQPPKEWIFGLCQDCKRRFEPKLPKQYYCEPCRDKDSLRHEILSTGVARLKHMWDTDITPLKNNGWIYRQQYNGQFGKWLDPEECEWVSTSKALKIQRMRENE